MLGTYPISSVPLSSLGIYATVPASAGSYVVTGQTARLGVALNGGVGAYALAGQAARLGVIMRLGPGAYHLTGYAATLRYIDNLRLRGRDFSGPQYRVRDSSEGYW
jgi:hypothetical protein